VKQAMLHAAGSWHSRIALQPFKEPFTMLTMIGGGYAKFVEATQRS
jgi:hypothetical protein